MRKHVRRVAVIMLIAGALGALCAILANAQHAAPTGPAPTTAAPTTRPFKALVNEHLPNAHVVTPKVFSGAQPEGDEGFKYLSELGVKTIVSVDGAKPDVAGAKKFGMRYVHLPIGYDGVSDEQGEKIAK